MLSTGCVLLPIPPYLGNLVDLPKLQTEKTLPLFKTQKCAGAGNNYWLKSKFAKHLCLTLGIWPEAAFLSIRDPFLTMKDQSFLCEHPE